MKHGIFIAKNTIYLTLLLFLTACGSAPEREKTNQPSVVSQKSMVIDESNYVKLSQYYFSRQSRYASTKKDRGLNHPMHPGENKVGKQAIAIGTVTPFDNDVQKMTLSQNGVDVIVSVDSEKGQVTISYDDKKRAVVHKTMSVEEFQNINGGSVL